MVLLTKHPRRWTDPRLEGGRKPCSSLTLTLALGKEAIHCRQPATSLKVRSFDFRRRFGSEVSQRKEGEREIAVHCEKDEEMRAARPTFDFRSAARSLSLYLQST